MGYIVPAVTMTIRKSREGEACDKTIFRSRKGFTSTVEYTLDDMTTAALKLSKVDVAGRNVVDAVRHALTWDEIGGQQAIKLSNPLHLTEWITRLRTVIIVFRKHQHRSSETRMPSSSR